jgi:hypothetical protein
MSPPDLTDEQRAALADLREHWKLSSELIGEAGTPELRRTRVLAVAGIIRTYRPTAFEPAHRAKAAGLRAIARVAAAFDVVLEGS